MRCLGCPALAEPDCASEKERRSRAPVWLLADRLGPRPTVETDSARQPRRRLRRDNGSLAELARSAGMMKGFESSSSPGPGPAPGGGGGVSAGNPLPIGIRAPCIHIIAHFK